MHNYSGVPQFPQSISLIDDSDTPNAGNFSPGWEGNRDALVYIRAVVGANAAMNWSAPLAPPGGQAYIAGIFDKDITVLGGSTFNVYNRWGLTAWDATAAGGFYYTANGGRTITSVMTLGSGFTPIAKCLTAASGARFIQFGRSSKVYYDNITIQTSTGSGWDSTFGVAYYHTGVGKSFFVGGTQSGGTFTGGASSFNTSGNVNTNLSGVLPTGWGSATNHAGEFFAANNGTDYLVAMGGVTAGSDTSRLLNAGALTAPTDITPAICTGKIITGIAWDPTKSLWLMMLNSSVSAFLYTSPDHVTWTLVATVVNVPLKNIFPVAGALCSVDLSGNRSGGGSTLYVSKDNFTTADAAGVVNDTGALYGGCPNGLFASGTNIAFSQFAMV